MEKNFHIEEYNEQQDEPRQRTFEVFDELKNHLNSPENYILADDVLKEEGACQELAENIKEYSQSLKQREKIIGENNSVIDILGNIQTCLFAYLNRIKHNKGNERAEKNVVEKEKVLDDYFFLLQNYPEFETEELGSKDGFLGSMIKDETDPEKQKKLKEITTDKVEQVKFYRDFLLRQEMTAIKSHEIKKKQSGEKFDPHFDVINPDTLTDLDLNIYKKFKQHKLTVKEKAEYARSFDGVEDFYNDSSSNFCGWIGSQFEHPENLKWFNPREYAERKKSGVPGFI